MMFGQPMMPQQGTLEFQMVQQFAPEVLNQMRGLSQPGQPPQAPIPTNAAPEPMLPGGDLLAAAVASGPHQSPIPFNNMSDQMMIDMYKGGSNIQQQHAIGEMRRRKEAALWGVQPHSTQALPPRA
jgi:hypothetical protein